MLSQSKWLLESTTDPHTVIIQMTTGITYWPTCCHNPDDYRNHLLTHRQSKFNWLLFLLLLRRHYSPMLTFASLTDFCQSALYFDLSFHFVMCHILISVWTQFHHLFFGRPPSRLPWIVKYLTCLFFTKFRWIQSSSLTVFLWSCHILK